MIYVSLCISFFILAFFYTFSGEEEHMELKTPLYEEHVRLGGTIVPFAGYLLPVQYPSGVIKEHKGECRSF